jgi:SAM-dependent methyltransferase
MAENLQKKLDNYYAASASNYDAQQFHVDDEHFNALMFLRGIIEDKKYSSILDVGSGTGRALMYLQAANPSLYLRGVEPVAELRQQAIQKGLSTEQIITGSGYNLPFPDRSFDCVTAFAVLHHVEDPERVIREMLRVAKQAIFISDHNIYGWGSPLSCFVKRLLRKTLGFRGLKLLMTRGSGYHDTDYDGIFFPFSIYDHLPLIASSAHQMLTAATKGKPLHLYSQASHVAVFANLDQPRN